VRSWVRQNLFGGPLDSLITIALVLGALYAVAWILDWAVLSATFSAGSAQSCRLAAGACWPILLDNLNLLLFGTFPAELRWRAAVALLIVLAGVALLLMPATRRWPIALPSNLLAVAAAFVLVGGLPQAGLPPVDLDAAGGLLLTVLLVVGSLPLALPIAVILALGRRSELPAVRALSTIYIEGVRALPMVVILFLVSVMLPLLLQGGIDLPKVFRAMIGITGFAAAYQAEVIRGGLQAVPLGQIEAAKALGLGYLAVQWTIVLPQALAIIVRPLSGVYVTFLKDTSLVSVIGLFELTGIATMIITKPEWMGYSTETYVAIGVVYYLMCAAIARGAGTLERTLTRHRMR
jgi:general L-amino acid transport system permease protein